VLNCTVLLASKLSLLTVFKLIDILEGNFSPPLIVGSLCLFLILFFENSISPRSKAWLGSSSFSFVNDFLRSNSALIWSSVDLKRDYNPNRFAIVGERK